jgi:MOSC domain-containing protein YiiM
MIITRIFISPEHVYAGHYGGPAGTAPMLEVGRAQLLAGRGLAGDRYYDRDVGHKGQATFFAEETWLKLRTKLAQFDRGPEVFRRNFLVRDADLLSLIDAEFEIQGIRFRGSEYCKPCFWMDQAFAPGTLAALTAWSAGGLRARVLTDGWVEAEAALPTVRAS